MLIILASWWWGWTTSTFACAITAALIILNLSHITGGWWRSWLWSWRRRSRSCLSGNCWLFNTSTSTAEISSNKDVSIIVSTSFWVSIIPIRAGIIVLISQSIIIYAVFINDSWSRLLFNDWLWLRSWLLNDWLWFRDRFLNDWLWLWSWLLNNWL